MKKYNVLYKDDFASNEIKSMTIIAETKNDAANYFFENYSGFFLSAEFIDWA